MMIQPPRFNHQTASARARVEVASASTDPPSRQGSIVYIELGDTGYELIASPNCFILAYSLI